MSYTFGIFRNYELDLNGQPNENGIESAPIETVLRFIEISVDFIIFTFVIVHFLHLTVDQVHDQPFLSYWILIDSVIMFFTLPYVKLCQQIMFQGEVIKNIFTIYQVQKSKLKLRREQNGGNKSNWKKFFDNNNEDEEEEEEIIEVSNGSKVFGGLVSQSPAKNKKKVEEDEFANEIEMENRKNEQDDETSEEDGAAISDDDSDDDAMLKKNAKREIVVKEEDYEENEKLNFSADVYNFTICANMTKCCSPVQQSFALYKCLFVFSIQVLVPVFFVLEFGLTNFKWPKRESMATRLICSLLLHMIIFGELK